MTTLRHRASCVKLFLVYAIVLYVPLDSARPVRADDRLPRWSERSRMTAPEAIQAAAADRKWVYVVNNTTVARYDRTTHKKVAESRGAAQHLNSALLHAGKLYCAHSNYPNRPERSEIKVLDTDSMELTTFHDFGDTPHGSLTVALFDRNTWWCVFAVYGQQENHRTVLVQYDTDWNQLALFRFPDSVIEELGTHSISGGVWRDGVLLATGHDKPVVYELTLPSEGNVLQHERTRASPFPGQGIAVDPATDGLLGIHRQHRQVIFAEREAGTGTK